MSTPFPRYNAVARRLTTLPTEVVHQVLNDLDVLKVLEIICSNNHPHIDSSVQSHRQLSRLLSPQRFTQVKDAFTLYHEICRSRRSPAHPKIDALKRDASAILSQKLEILPLILNAIKAELESFSTYLPSLSKFSPAELLPYAVCQNLNEVSDLRAHWNVIHGAEVALNKTKSAQLNRLADLMTEYPGMLKSVSDHSQEPRRDAQHQAEMLRQSAQKMLKPQLADHRIMSLNIFGHHRFPWVPYDKHLKKFLRVVEKFPIEAPKNVLTGRPKYELVYKWPSEVVSDIDTVTEGLAYVYIRAPAEPGKKEDGLMETDEEEKKGPQRVLRTKYSKYSDASVQKSKGLNQPCFIALETQTWQVDPGCDGLSPFEEKEFQWLEAFLRVCRHISGLGQVAWSPERSVAEFWNFHVKG